MKFIFLILLTVLCTPSPSQELKSKKIYSRFYIETFQIDKTSKQRNGNYLMTKVESHDTLVSGKYKNNAKIGVWKYYSKQNKPWMSYDFDKKLLVQIPEEISKVDTFMINKNDVFLYGKVDSPPVYLGFEREVENRIINNFRLSANQCESGFSGIGMASFIVDKNGRMTGYQTKQAPDKDMNINMLRAFNTITGEWLPARVNGQAVDSKILLIFEVTPPGVPNTFDSSPNILVMHITYFGIKRTQVVQQRVIRPDGSQIGSHPRWQW